MLSLLCAVELVRDDELKEEEVVLKAEVDDKRCSQLREARPQTNLPHLFGELMVS